MLLQKAKERKLLLDKHKINPKESLNANERDFLSDIQERQQQQQMEAQQKEVAQDGHNVGETLASLLSSQNQAETNEQLRAKLIVLLFVYIPFF
jgi:hypothetical protein